MIARGKGEICAYCGRELEATTSASGLAATRDHFVARMHFKKGHAHHSNKVWACRKCNNLKANMTPSEWARFTEQNPRWWSDPRWQFGIPLLERTKYCDQPKVQGQVELKRTPEGWPVVPASRFSAWK